ncbi:MAG: hypothetical protein VKK80_14105 [Prochlorothrix sp.]|nr:hypothetical protein [Prochlorothrix sp.]
MNSGLLVNPGWARLLAAIAVRSQLAACLDRLVLRSCLLDRVYSMGAFHFGTLGLG